MADPLDYLRAQLWAAKWTLRLAPVTALVALAYLFIRGY